MYNEVAAVKKKTSVKAIWTLGSKRAGFVSRSDTLIQNCALCEAMILAILLVNSFTSS